MTAYGPERRFLDVRCGAALGGQADVARIDGKEKQPPPKHRTRCRRRPKGRRFSFRGANSTFTPTRQANVTSPTASNIAAAFAGFAASFRIESGAGSSRLATTRGHASL